VCYEPQADISSTSPVTLGHPITFTATVTGTGPFTYSWDFGGPGYGVGLDTATPVYTYTAHGDYDVELLVQGVCGSDTVTETVAVKPVFQTYLPLLLKQAY
jgi:PKD repeat protein